MSGCSTPTTFRVLDAETGNPIEGAVALATWSMGSGWPPGLSYGYTAKAIEAVSDRDGYFTIPGVTGKIAFNTPFLQVYKPGYVGWNSRRIYLGYYDADIKLARTKRRENFVMKDQDIFLEPWKNDGRYNYNSHGSFIGQPSGFEEGFEEGENYESKYWKAKRYETPFSVAERDQWDKEGRRKNRKWHKDWRMEEK
ncbi:MAG TPA: carboxypeptidase regulatory-like domain-containing protein [Desulfobacterales bacterium]|nr:carboxypeptidase regulatory-like domain-containing protein [Desulfobacterales bacterium]